VVTDRNWSKEKRGGVRRGDYEGKKALRGGANDRGQLEKKGSACQKRGRKRRENGGNNRGKRVNRKNSYPLFAD